MKRIRGKVRLAIVGTGGISGAHAKGILAHPEAVECVALCDISEKNMKGRSDQLGGVGAQFKDWRRMLERMGDSLDAVLICLPHHLHARCILDCAAAGKHVLCEKPMCISLAEADAIARAVRRARVTYMSAHNQLFMPVVREARRMIDAGRIGAVRWLRSQDCFTAQSAWFKGTWRARVRTQGGGELIDTGYHPTYRLLHLAKAPVVGVRGSMSRFLLDIEGEDAASVQVRFANGALGEILTSWAFNLPHGSHQIHVVGETGELFGTESKLFFLPAGFSEPAQLTLPATDTFADQMAHFAECRRTGVRPLHSLEEGRAGLEVILAATRDAAGWRRYAPRAESF